MDRFLFVANQYPPNVVGGAELSVQTLVDALHARGHETAVVSLAQDDVSRVDTVHGTRVYRLPVRNLYHPFRDGVQPAARRLLWHAADTFNPLMGRALGRVLDAESPTWVSTHNLGGFSVAAWMAARVRGIPVVQVLHDYYLLCPRTTMFRGERSCGVPCTQCRVLSAPKKRLSRHVSVAVGISRFVLNRHLELGYFPGVRTGVAYNGRPMPPMPALQPRAPGAPLRVGYIGRVEATKGIEVLLSAVARLPPDRCTLSVAGRFRDESYRRELVSRFPLKNVTYLGFVSPETFYPQVDVVVVPSLWEEPLGMVAVEPLGYGVPVIVSATGGLPEVLEGGGGAGWLFPPGDVDALFARLSELANGWPDEEARRAAALVQRRRFTPERQVEQYLSVLAG